LKEWASEVDVLVVGSGGCGLAAAIAAHDAGAGVGIVEKLKRPGGNTALSTGSIPGAGTRFQRSAGIDDSPDLMYSDLIGLSGEHDATALTRLLVDRSAELVEWLADVAEVRLDVVRDYKHVAHSVPRLHAPASRKGQDLTDDLLRTVAKRGIPLALANPVRDLEVDDSRAVVGVRTETDSHESIWIGARKTILAVNGFGADRELVQTYCPEIVGAMYVGAPGSEGEAIRWGRKLDAALGNMASYQGYASVIYPHGELLSWTTLEKGGILVNALGERFGNEPLGYSGFTPYVMRQQPPIHAIFDQRIRDIAAREPWFKELLDYGGAKRADSIAALAVEINVEPARLDATIADYNHAAAGKMRDRHGRSDFGIAPLAPPFWFARVLPALLSTQGGLMIDSSGHVLDRGGRPIPNLFAGGGAVAGISGRSGAVGYASGNGLLHAIGLGWLAGLAAADEVRRGV